MSGHHWVGTDQDDINRCLVCGGVWQKIDPKFSAYTEHYSFRGEAPSSCTHNTQQCHHYGGECPEDTCNIDEDCNCLFCEG